MSNLTGASFLADQFRTMIADAKAKLAKAGDDMKVAVTDLNDTADHAVAQVKIVQNETADLKAALGLGSNGSPEPLDDVHVAMHVTPLPGGVKYVVPTVTPPPPVAFRLNDVVPPPPFYGPAKPPIPHDDTGAVKQIILANGELSPNGKN